ncbi:MAG: SDR family oxidoreductase [Anaerolineae bacterium]|nr:SDR family oxidoreductase [Anaerolineae bacterium]
MKDTNKPKVVLITGASSGIGKACATHLGQLGHHVYGTSRRAPETFTIATISSTITMIYMDVNNTGSVKTAVDKIIAQEGRLDAVVNNAGFGFAGAIEDTSIEEAKATLETNFFGTLRVCQAALPTLRQQGYGYIINISSIGGIIGIPYQGLYSASKFAIEGLSEALRMELKPFGVHVVIIEPGDTRTQFTANRQIVEQSKHNPAYKEQFERTLKIVEADENNGVSPEMMAQTLARILNTRKPRLRYPVGAFDQRNVGLLKRILPWSLAERFLMQHYKIQQ